MIGPVVDVVLPEGCWGGGMGAAEFGLSRAVREGIGRLAAERYCLHCGLTIGPYESHDARNPCGRCGERDVGVVRVARVGRFDEPLVGLIHRMKFGRAWEVARVLAPFLSAAMRGASETVRVPVDIMVPVPLHWRREAKRGFNQANELAREVRKLTGWPLANVLRRVRATREQAQVETPGLRAENLRGAFVCRRGAGAKLAGKHVWLIDDVSTTGATLHAAASALRRLRRGERPASINAAVVCVTERRDC